MRKKGLAALVLILLGSGLAGQAQQAPVSTAPLTADVPARGETVPVGTEVWFQPWFVRQPNLGPNAARLVVRAP